MSLNTCENNFDARNLKILGIFLNKFWIRRMIILIKIRIRNSKNNTLESMVL